MLCKKNPRKKFFWLPPAQKKKKKTIRALGYCRCKLFPKSDLGSEFCYVIFFFFFGSHCILMVMVNMISKPNKRKLRRN